MDEMILSAAGVPIPEMTLREYFSGILRAERSGNQFPVDFDVIWPLVFTEKGSAKRALLSQFVEGVHFVFDKNAKNEDRTGRKPEVIMLSVACTEFFVASRRKDVFEIYRQCRQVVMAQLEAIVRAPQAMRIWDTLNPHIALVSRFAPGYFTTLSVSANFIVAAEKEILLHDMMTYTEDRPDTSIGMRWAPVFTATFGENQRMRHPKVVLGLPGRKKQVQPWLYPNQAYSLFQEWFLHTYIPEHLVDYLRNKETLEDYPHLSKESAANNLSVLYTGSPARLSQKTLELINRFKADGIERITPVIANRLSLEDGETN